MSCAAHGLAASRKMLVQEDVDLIREAVAMLPSDRVVQVVDLGLGSGTTALSVFAERLENVRVLSVDSDVYWGSEAVKNIGRLDDFRAVKDSILTASAEISDGEVDMLIVDCDPDDTERILKVWIPKLAAGALVWVHDYGDPKEFGVPFNRYEKNEAVSRDVGVIVNAGLLEEIKVSGLGWLGRLGGWSGQKPTVPKEAVEANVDKDGKVTAFDKGGKALPDDPLVEIDNEGEVTEVSSSDPAPAASPPESPEPSSELAEQPESSSQGDSPQESEELGKKKAGRPKGSKNKPKDD